jgi:hypothetical protein
VSMGGFVFGALHRGDFFSFALELRGTGSVVPGSGEGHALRGLFVGGAAVPCYHRGPFLACGALHLGGLEGSADGRKRIHTEEPFVLALGVRPGFERAFSAGFAVRGFVEPTVLITQPYMIGSESGEVWRASRMCVSVGLALTMPL